MTERGYTHNMDQFLDWILSEVSATMFLEYLQKSQLPRNEVQRLFKLAFARESEMIANHAINPNEY